jgi:hypothetical protein
MTEELKNRIRDFIVSWDNTIDDESMGLADYDLFLETAISLLEETIEEKQMTKTLADDIAYAISCVQDYLDTIDRPYRLSSVEEQEHYDTIRLRIERLMRFYYQLTGFDPNGEKK